MTLCTTCTEVLYQKKRWLNDFDDDSSNGSSEQNFVFGHHETGATLSSAAAAGCMFCLHLWNQLSDEEHEVVRNARGEGYVSLVLLKPGDMGLGVDLESCYSLAMMLGDKGNLSEALAKVTKKETPAFSLFSLQPSSELEGTVFGHPASDNTSSSEAWDTVTRWLRECRTQHERCSQTRANTRWYPTRLLDLGPNGQGPPEIKLVETRDVKMHGSPYVTLSHCWGPRQFQTLTRESYNDFRNGVLIRELPKTFQDAVTIACRLAVRYLWIDSLCIVQNDAGLADWLQEATRMLEVYSNAVCNISAAGSSDSSQGLFYQRNPATLYHNQLDLCLDPERWVEEAPPLTKYVVTDFTFWQKRLAQAPLHQRGWVVQERLLARCVIHFGRDQLFWECQELDACESYPAGLPPILKVGINTKFKGLDPALNGEKLRRLGPHDSESRFFAHQLWPRIVEAYSRCLLTKPEDKLIAISGIAKKLSAVIGDDYVVGMWRRYLASELLWSVDKCRQIDNEPSRRPSPYRCPSFSWASVDGCISAASPVDEGILIAVRDVCIDYVTDDKTGLVRGGHLVVQGTLKALELTRHSALRTHWRMLVNAAEVKQAEGPAWEQLGPLVELDVDQPDFEAENGAGALFCVPARQGVGGYWTHYTCLVLESVGAGVYRRLGLARTAKREEIDIIAMPHANEAALPCVSYDPEERLHTFHLV